MADVVLIQRSECIGNSRRIINDNFTSLSVAASENTLSLNNLVEFVDNNTALVSQVSSSSLFLPVNYNTESNANVTVVNHSYNFSGSNTTPSTSTTTTNQTVNQRIWWSGARTVNLLSVPSNTVAALLKIDLQAKTYANNTVKLYIRKSGESWGAPNQGPGDINSTFATSFQANFNKIALAPVGGPNVSFEAQESSTFIVYLDGTGLNRTFDYTIVDLKDSSDSPNNFPIYNINISLLGYYQRII